MRKRIKWGNIYITFIVIATIITATVERIQNKPTESEQSFSEYKTTQTEQTVAHEEKIHEIEEVEEEELEYRMTYYYTNDPTGSTKITASGITTDQFKINQHGWYTYNGKLVIATANKRLLSWDKYKNSTQKMFNLYDELTLIINDVEYQAIALDVCGACMLSNKIDLFVKDRASGLDTKIKVKEVK